jgi:hypothetical protein
MYMRFRILVPLLAVAGVSACDLTNPRDQDFRQVAIHETNRRDSLWHALNIHDYDFSFHRACACSDKATQPVTIHVRSDQVARVLDAGGVEVAPQSDIPWPTIDSLYVWTLQLLNNRAFSVAVVFDTIFQFPDSIVGQNSTGTSVSHVSLDFVQQTPGTAALTAYRMGEPFSKSKRVTWRSR